MRAAEIVLAGLFLIHAGMVDAAAHDISYPKPADPVPGTPGVAHVDILRLVVPGMVVGEEVRSGSQILEFRHIDGGWRDTVPAGSRIELVTSVALRSGGRQRTALLVDFGTVRDRVEDIAVLALFDLAEEPRLLDAVGVGFDRDTNLQDHARLALGDNDALVTVSHHSNSSQTYVTHALILAHDDRFELIDAISTFSDRHCGFQRRQELAIGVVKDGAIPASIAASVTDSTTHSTEECDTVGAPDPGTRNIAVTYHWTATAAAYAPDSDAFEVLARENEQRF